MMRCAVVVVDGDFTSSLAVYIVPEQERSSTCFELRESHAALPLARYLEFFCHPINGKYIHTA